ncbi:hypothetical protein [Micromonospora auratinigra]|uniref:PQQ-like domain-containing protein n=1 Tax=Micromonospora auratinigra TaxID=261654 RepID=A0A1A8ZHN9_9ACTN|nr:hypothetical protein [Micromonospora auratinigra]SBT43545.1 hypothetical protein GA0070611_2359 [Micromonospora auratinigra]
MTGPLTVELPGQVWGLACADPAGPIYLTSCAGRSPSVRNLYTTVLTAADPTGAVLWQRSFPGRPFPPRVGTDGTVWVTHHDGADPPRVTLTGVGADGATRRVVIPQQEPGEYPGAVVRMPDGFLALWLPASPYRRPPPGSAARLARYDETGDAVWSTRLRLDAVSFSGVVEAGVTTGWQLRPKEKWRPSTLVADHRQPLLVAGDRILAGISDGRSGIGCCSIVDSERGAVVSTTAPGPYHHKAVAGPGRFLVGAQGYGAFATTLHDHAGRPARTWPSHGQWLIDQRGRICGPESENVLPSRSRFRVLEPDGSTRDGPALTGYHTSYPALDADGTAVFWRDGTLVAVDAGLTRHELFHRADDDRTVLSRVLLLADDTVALALDNELHLFPDTGVGPLAAGPWPCDEGGLRGNPVLPAPPPTNP